MRTGLLEIHDVESSGEVVHCECVYHVAELSRKIDQGYLRAGCFSYNDNVVDCFGQCRNGDAVLKDREQPEGLLWFGCRYNDVLLLELLNGNALETAKRSGASPLTASTASSPTLGEVIFYFGFQFGQACIESGSSSHLHHIYPMRNSVPRTRKRPQGWTGSVAHT